MWDDVNEILYSGERNGTINQWNKNSEPQFKILCQGNSNYYLNSKDIRRKKFIQSRREKNLKHFHEIRDRVQAPLNDKELKSYILIREKEESQCQSPGVQRESKFSIGADSLFSLKRSVNQGKVSTFSGGRKKKIVNSMYNKR